MSPPREDHLDDKIFDPLEGKPPPGLLRKKTKHDKVEVDDDIADSLSVFMNKAFQSNVADVRASR